MPDVKMFMHDSLANDDVRDKVQDIVAEQMSCTVDGEYYELDPREEIDLLIFRDNETVDDGPYDITIVSHTNVIMEVAAYDFADRMSNIGERIARIAESVKELLISEHDPELTVSITFIPVEQGHWTKA